MAIRKMPQPITSRPLKLLEVNRRLISIEMRLKNAHFIHLYNYWLASVGKRGILELAGFDVLRILGGLGL